MNLSRFKKSQKAQNHHYLLFGHPIGHSWSPLMHNTALRHYNMKARYHAVDVQNDELNSLASYLNKDTFLGGNITVPYKQLIVNYLDQIDSTARDIGAVNTIVKQDYQLEGYNTDYTGFLAPLEDYSWDLEGGRAIIFGTGGASRAIVAGLTDFGMQELYLVSRDPDNKNSFSDYNRVKVISYDEWTSYAVDAVLIVNATPLGMYPEISRSPIRETEREVLADSICYYIVYNPLQTTFLQQAKSVGAATIGGLEMLIQQGSQSFKLWTGRPFPIEKVRATFHEKLAN